MDGSQTTKLFRHGANQAVDIPQGFELAGEDVTIRKDGERLIIEPARNKPTLEEVLARLALEPPLDADERLEPFQDQPPQPFSL